MSNRVYLSKVRVEYVKDKIKETGYKIFDDLVSVVETFMYEESVPDDDLELLAFVCKEAFDENTKELIQFVYENKKDITINGVLYKFQDIKEVMRKSLFVEKTT